MKTLVLIIFLVVTLLFGSCSEPVSTEEKLDSKEQIAKFDADKDNKVSREEWLLSSKTEFAQFDKDNDGFIQKNEMKSKKIPGSGRRFIKIDMNHDNQITMQEWLAPKEKHFEIKDRNRDGFITEDELKPIKSIKKRIAKFDTDKDGKISSDEWISSRKERFLKFDEDKDGFINMEEWLVPSEKKFNKKDSNQDGFITEDEWTATRLKKKK